MSQELASGRWETGDMLILLGQREIVHTQIMEELARLGIAVSNRQDALDRADELAWWYHLEDEEE
jgi:hypothetical protein